MIQSAVVYLNCPFRHSVFLFFFLLPNPWQLPVRAPTDGKTFTALYWYWFSFYRTHWKSKDVGSLLFRILRLQLKDVKYTLSPVLWHAHHFPPVNKFSFNKILVPFKPHLLYSQRIFNIKISCRFPFKNCCFC